MTIHDSDEQVSLADVADVDGSTDADESAGLVGDDSPEIGTYDGERTHTAHARYAAADHPGVIWFDPRDGRERYNLDVDVTICDFDDADGRILTNVEIYPRRPDDRITGMYTVKQHRQVVEILERFHAGMGVVESVARPIPVVKADVFESLEDARDWCREHIDGYSDAPRKNALER